MTPSLNLRPSNFFGKSTPAMLTAHVKSSIPCSRADEACEAHMVLEGSDNKSSPQSKLQERAYGYRFSGRQGDACLPFSNPDDIPRALTLTHGCDSCNVLVCLHHHHRQNKSCVVHGKSGRETRNKVRPPTLTNISHDLKCSALPNLSSCRSCRSCCASLLSASSHCPLPLSSALLHRAANSTRLLPVYSPLSRVHRQAIDRRMSRWTHRSRWIVASQLPQTSKCHVSRLQ